jgi:hypothetical protein
MNNGGMADKDIIADNRRGIRLGMNNTVFLYIAAITYYNLTIVTA